MRLLPEGHLRFSRVLLSGNECSGGYGHLYEKDEGDTGILRIIEADGIAPGYYVLTAISVRAAEQTGIVLTSVSGDRTGYPFPRRGTASLEEALATLMSTPERASLVETLASTNRFIRRN